MHLVFPLMRHIGRPGGQGGQEGGQQSCQGVRRIRRVVMQVRRMDPYLGMGSCSVTHAPNRLIQNSPPIAAPRPPPLVLIGDCRDR